MKNAYTVIIPIEIEPDEEGAYLQAYQDAADVMTTQPGFIRTDMFRSITSGNKFRLVNVAQWQTRDSWEKAMSVCSMIGKQIGVGHPGGYEVIRTIVSATELVDGHNAELSASSGDHALDVAAK